MIKVDINKAKENKLHPERRMKRAAVFTPVDGNSPYASLNEVGEALRAEIKAIDDDLQVRIDAAQTEEELKAIHDEIHVAYSHLDGTAPTA